MTLQGAGLRASQLFYVDAITTRHLKNSKQTRHAARRTIAAAAASQVALSIVTIAALSHAALATAKQRQNALPPPVPARRSANDNDCPVDQQKPAFWGGLSRVTWLPQPPRRGHTLELDLGQLEERCALEEQQRLRLWDERWELRRKTLPELRSIAA
jgi:hypothetical protein